MTSRRNVPRAVIVLAGAVAVFLLIVAYSTFREAFLPSVSPGASHSSVLPGNLVSWIQGVVTVGPPCPSSSADTSPCPSKPLAGAVIEQRFADGGTATTTSGQDGSYEFVQPGTVTVTILGEPVRGVSATPRPATVRISAGSGVHLDLRYVEGEP